MGMFSNCDTFISMVWETFDNSINLQDTDCQRFLISRWDTKSGHTRSVTYR
jgi:hypothetical protein